ncbi:MAG: hypothetical protein LBH00_09590 [Planctomycetaceae bacterium]|nr:hypothetical protein [Planctomycetaceae bacterium]
MIIAASVLFTGYFIMPWLGLFSSFVVLFYGKMWWKLIGAVALVLNLFMCAVNGTLNMIVRFI